MNNKTLQHYFLLTILSGVIILTFFILRPFIYVIILALMCATVFEPMHKKVLYLSRNNQGLAALATTIIIIIIILIPFIFLGIKVFGEVQQFYSFFANGNGKDAVISISNGLMNGLQKYFPFGQNISIDSNQYVEQGLLWLLNHLAYIFGSVTKLLFNFFIFLIITYYALKDGPKIKKIIISVSPLADSDDEIIFKKIKIAINSVIKGSLVMAFVQGILTAIGFGLFGVPNAALWGIAATMASLVPGLGTAIVSVPAVIYVFLTGNIFMALGFSAWSIVVVGLVDNFLRPILIGKEVKIHPLIIFLSVLGGIIFLGPVGFLLGPLVISLLFTLLDTYASLRSSRLS